MKSYQGILNRKGKKLYGEIFPSGNVPLFHTHPVRKLGQSVFLIDSERLSPEQINQIIDLTGMKVKRMKVIPKKLLPQAKEEMKQKILENQCPIHKRFFKSIQVEPTRGTKQVRIS